MNSENCKISHSDILSLNVTDKIDLWRGKENTGKS